MGHLHWAIWALESGMLAPSDVAPSESRKAKAVHAATAVAHVYLMLQQQSAGRSSAFTGKLAGCERDVQRLSSVALTYLTKVYSCLTSSMHE